MEIVVAAIIAIVVPFVTFRLALRQDHIRWLRDRRAEVYIDMLTEAYAAQQWINYDMADDETRARMQSYQTDIRLSPLERARLGARSNVFASQRVNKLANGVEAAYGPAGLKRLDEGDRIVVRDRVLVAFEKLQAAVRDDIGADKLDRPSPFYDRVRLH